MSWTKGRVNTFITGVLRQGFRRWPAKFEALKEACVGERINKATGRKARHYKCAKCRKLFPKAGVQVDHVLPVVDPKTGWVSWDTYIERLYCAKTNLQVMCRKCHKTKTKAER